jgi:hypothetical protein
MGWLDSIGQGISNGVSWAGETAKKAKDAVVDGAGVVWDKTTDAANTVTNQAAGIYAAATNAGAEKIGLGSDAPLPKQWGTIEGYSGRWPKNEAIKGPIKVTLPWWMRGAQAAASVANAQTSSGTTIQTPGESFLYLDVGRWGGKGSDGKRDFGIVCGRTAALCAFTQGSEGSYTQVPGGDQVTDAPEDEKGPINALLAKLGGSELGKPKVRRFKTARMPLPPGTSSLAQKVYVIIGDMHLPVVSGVVANGAQPQEQIDLKGRRVGRTRRTDAFKDLGVMSDSDASLWHERYINGEIFQTAGKDLATFGRLLAAAKGNIGGAELWVMQLGDMFDLWLGFDRFFKADPPKSGSGDKGRMYLEDMQEAPPPDYSAMAAAMSGGAGMAMMLPPPTTPRLQDTTPRTVTTGVEFVDTWIHRTMYNTSQGEYVRSFLQFDPKASKFLYGNHDNYLGAHVPGELMKLRGGQGMAKEFHDSKAFMYASHGHQWDSFNRDGATAGLGTTQAAFWGGKWVRELEPDDRECSIRGAVDFYRKRQKPFCVFVMGHTHTALLAEIVIDYEAKPELDTTGD